MLTGFKHLDIANRLTDVRPQGGLLFLLRGVSKCILGNFVPPPMSVRRLTFSRDNSRITKEKICTKKKEKCCRHRLKNDIQVIHDFTNDLNTVDVTNRLKYDHKGDIVFNFGKYAGQLVSDVLQKDKQYYHWIQEKEFSAQVKQIVKRIMKENDKK